MTNFLKKTKNWFIAAIIGGSVFAAAEVLTPSNTIVIYQEANKIEVGTTTKNYIASQRNFKDIQFETLRTKIDWKYNQVHDALSQAYYEEKPFVWQGKDWGILTKDQFDKLQSLLWAKYEIMFHNANLKQPLKQRISEKDYNFIYDREGNIIGKKTDQASTTINNLKIEGYEISL